MIFKVRLSFFRHPIHLRARACGLGIKITKFQKLLNAFVQTRFCQINLGYHVVDLADWFWLITKCQQYFLVRHSTGPAGGHSGCREGGSLYCNHSEISNHEISNLPITKSGITKWCRVNPYGNDSLGTSGPSSNVVNSAREWAECGRAESTMQSKPHDRGCINERRPQNVTGMTYEQRGLPEVAAA